VTLQVVVFSKNRPLQLHGYLVSLHDCCRDDLAVTVIAKSEPEWYSKAYLEVADEFPAVHWRQELVFADDLLASIDPEIPYTMFGCDDAVFTGSFGVDDTPWSGVIGRSLRLGHHITRDMFGNHMPKPEVLFDVWSVDEGVVDWAYPWEVLGTIYQTEFALKMVRRINAPSPSQLEARGALCWREETDKRLMAARGVSSLVVPTVNLVQNEYPNGIAGTVPLETGFLLECWNHGLRMDTGRYRGMKPPSWRVPDFWLRRA
jgi:hypothetical protein